MARLGTRLLGGVGALAAVGGGLALFTGWTARRVEKALPPKGRFIEVDGARLHYLDLGQNMGEGPAIVMIHGLGGQVGNFTYALTERLTDRFRVIVVERPGAGYSDSAPGASARLAVQAETIAHFIAALGLERPLVVGHSLGGAVALALALDHPDRVGALALISPLTHPQDSAPGPFRGLVIPSPWLRRLVAWTLATPASILQRQPALDALFGPEAAPDDFATKGGGLLNLRPRSFYAASTDLMALGDDLPGLVERYPSLTLPVGVLFGDGDRILDPAVHGKAMVGPIAGLDFEIVEGGGHMIPLTQPERVAAFIVRIARRMGAQPAETKVETPKKRARKPKTDKSA